MSAGTHGSHVSCTDCTTLWRSLSSSFARRRDIHGSCQVGFGDTLYGVKVGQGPRELLILGLLTVLTSLLAWLAVDMKDRKRSGSLVVFVAVAVASILLMACVLFSVYLVHEVVGDPTDDDWTVRKINRARQKHPCRSRTKRAA